jgi:2-(1,2-epoxy-1,2-dihydrophenyl)acetyl-CoA isomerase
MSSGAENTFSEILYAMEAGVATIRLNRAASLNALTPAMLGELSGAFDLAAADERVGALVLTGEGRGFCSGADLLATKPPVDEQGRPDLGYVLQHAYNPLILKMRALPKPIIAAVNGIAAGAGASLALMADITVAAKSAYFLEAFVNVGLVVDAGGTWVLPRLLGEQRAMALTLLGEKVSAEQAKTWGLVWEVTEDEQLLGVAQSLARKLASGPRLAVERIKSAIHAAAGNNLATQLELECRLQRECGYSVDFVEGSTAFAEKRKPHFKGH